jgi:hypothetical protein
MTSPGAAGLTAEQSAWIVTHDFVQIVALDGVRVRPRISLVNDAFVDGVGSTMQMEPGTHEVEVKFDDGGASSAGTTKLRIDSKAGKTYYIKNLPGRAVRYGVKVYDSTPTQVLLKSFKSEADPGFSAAE